MLSTHSLLVAKESKINIVFDIDGVLAFHSTRLSEKNTAYFAKYGLVISAADHLHYLAPGTVELIKILFSLPRVRVSFFSSGSKSRNIEFVEKLLKCALGNENYQAIKDYVKVLSREDRTYYDHNEESKQLARVCGSLFGEYKKDISKVLHPGDSIQEVILIDDDPSFTALDQHKNILVVPECSDHCYYFLENGDCSFEDDYHTSSFRGLNNIFYITGILMKLISDHRSGSQSITDALFKINYITYEEHNIKMSLKYGRSLRIQESNTPAYVANWNESMSDITIYQTGLRILRKFNPDLVIIDSEIYKTILMRDKNSKGI